MGRGKCHLRALHNVHEAAVQEAFKDDIRHTAANNNKVHAAAREYGEERGMVLHICKEHWVALTRKAPGSVEGLYYDDMVMMELNNYYGALEVLELLESMTEKGVRRCITRFRRRQKNQESRHHRKSRRSGELTNDCFFA